jgi:hypothetical protein
MTSASLKGKPMMLESSPPAREREKDSKGCMAQQLGCAKLARGGLTPFQVHVRVPRVSPRKQDGSIQEMDGV